MNLLEKLLSTDSIKKQLFAKMALTAKEQGIKRVLITINEDASFETDFLKDDFMVVEKKNYLFLLARHEKQKADLAKYNGANYQDTIKK